MVKFFKMKEVEDGFQGYIDGNGFFILDQGI